LFSLTAEQYRDLITSSHNMKGFFFGFKETLTVQVLGKLPCT